jgi:hypothetical protein
VPLAISITKTHDARHKGQKNLPTLTIMKIPFPKPSIFAFLVAALSGTIQAASAATVTTNGYEILVNGTRFVFKGVNYSPVPTGALPEYPPHGDYFIPYYENVWKGDLDLMRAAGVNSIRLYAGNPDLNAGAPGTAGNWKAFLDYAYNNNNRPIYVFMTSYLDQATVEHGGNLSLYQNQWSKLVKSTVNHPAVVGYTLGNEIFDRASKDPKSAFWQNYGKILASAYQAGIASGKAPFLIAAINDEPIGSTPNQYWPVIQAGEESGQIAQLNAWAINVYRGPHFGEPGNNPIPNYRNQMDKLRKKPLLIGEFGTPHSTRTAQIYMAGRKMAAPGTGAIVELDTIPAGDFGNGRPYEGGRSQGDFLTSEWKVIKGDYSKSVASSTVSGGFVFNWSDEWYKHGGDPSVHAGGPNLAFFGPNFAGGYWDEKWFGITDSLSQDYYRGSKTPVKRPTHSGYEALKGMYK